MIREVNLSEKKAFDKAAVHPLQSWEWGEFRKETGVDVTRLADEDDKKFKDVYQITWHKIPKTNYFIGYCPKSPLPTNAVLEKIGEIAKHKKAIFVKFEPNEKKNKETTLKIKDLSKANNFRPGKSLFTRFSLWLDLTPDENTLLKNMHPKTRYNIRLAERKGVKIVEDDMGFNDYWELMEETTRRQGFYAHSKSYHQKMWRRMKESGMGHLMKALYEGEVLTTWILFILNGVLYYPYGASSSTHRDVMASNLMMWEVIRFGKKNKCKLFDMWGSLGPEPDQRDPWYGFHRFKMGYGPELIEFVGTYDLVVSPGLYKFYGVVDKARWLALKTVARIRR